MEPVTKNLPVIAMRGLNVFPRMNTSFDLERPISVHALERAMENGEEIFLVTQREIGVEQPEEKDLYEIGTVARVTQILRVSDRVLRVMMEGACRARLKRLWQREPFLQAQVELIDEPATSRHSKRTEAMLRQTYASVTEYAELAQKLPDDVYAAILSTNDPGYLADFIAQQLNLRYQDKQDILDELRPLPRLQRMNEILRREIEVTAMEQDIESKVRSRVGKIQKDFVLREQIKVLQNEIGEGGEDEELDEYREKISKAHLSEEVERKLLKDVDKLAKQPFGSAEASVLRNYLDTCMEMPWGKEAKERASVDAARKILDRDHYGLQKVKERILEFIAVRQLNPEAKGQILCLVGPPGVGKTSIALSVAKAMNRKVARLSLGGVRDEADIRGHRKTYIGAMPGRIIEAISRSGSMNPLLVLDEVDKMGSDGRGDPASALLEVLDSEQNYAFRDHYLEIPVDLSRVMFIMTANTLDTIPRPLLDRMEIIEIPSYYLDTCMEMPWGKEAKERASVDAARKILDRDHYGLQKVKERILEFIAVRQLNPEAKGQILCLVGPPGVGKTSIALSVAKAMNRKVARLSLGGVRDEADIRGHRKTYIGAMPGRIIEAISRSGSMNPLLVLDEVDKMGSDGRGDPASALLEVLDSEQNYAFRDHYLEIPVDLSRVMFIMTANTLDTIPRPLLDRMEIIEIPSYTDEEKVQIAQRHLLPKERQAHGLTASSLRVDESAIRAAIALYTRESGVRSLERQLGKICRKAAMQLATSDVKRVTVTEKNIKDFLGAPRAAQEKIPEKDLVGVVNGLAWTEVGGEILPVEVGVMDGSGKVELTGNLGDVMQESCRAALSCLRQRAQELGIAPDFYKTKDIHIHFPEGAIPKDGPSAGIAIATAVLSALTGQAVHRDVAMTGEITLRGRVLAIGGLREKTMGALRAGVHTVIFPKENEKDLDEIDPLVREKLRFVPVETVDAVFAEALVLPEKCTAAAHESYLPPVQESAHSTLRAGEMS